jgi:uncharacterized protein (TIGR02266 family)
MKKESAPDMDESQSQRKHRRVEVILKVDYADSQAYVSDYTHNASGGGVFIATGKPFEIGDTISFSLSFPGVLVPIDCRGEVRWRRTAEEVSGELPTGVGVEFTFDSPQEAQRIGNLLGRLIDPPPADPAAPAGNQEEPFRVLVAEDNQMVRELFRTALKKFEARALPGGRKLEVVEAENGKEACDRLQEEPFHLAVIDYYMPVMDGMQVIRTIRENEEVRRLPIIVISAGGEDAQYEAFKAGADLFLGKPVRLPQLFQSLQLLLDLESHGEKESS